MQFYQWRQLYLNGSGQVYRFFSHAIPDVFYLPQRVAGKFLVLASYFRSHKLFVELALPQIIAIINNGTENFQFLQVPALQFACCKHLASSRLGRVMLGFDAREA